MDKYGSTCPGEGLTLAPLTEKLSKFNAKKKKGIKKYYLGTRRNKRGSYVDHFY